MLGDGRVQGFHQLVKAVDQAGNKAGGGGVFAAEGLAFHSRIVGEFADGFHVGLEVGVDFFDFLLEHFSLLVVQGRPGDAGAFVEAGLDHVHFDAFHFVGLGAIGVSDIAANRADGGRRRRVKGLCLGADPIGGGTGFVIGEGQDFFAEAADSGGQLGDADGRPAGGVDNQDNGFDGRVALRGLQHFLYVLDIAAAAKHVQVADVLGDNAADRDDRVRGVNLQLRRFAEHSRKHIGEIRQLRAQGHFDLCGSLKVGVRLFRLD